MSAVGAHLAPSLSVVRRDLLLAWSYRLQFMTGIFSGFISLALFYYVSRLVRVEQFTPDAYFAFAAIGIVIATVTYATIQLPQMTLQQELVAGTFERILLAPWGSAAAIVSLLVYPTLYALITVVGLLSIGAAVFGLDLQWSTVPLAAPVAVMSVLAFAPFGVLLLASVVVLKKPPPGASYVVAGLALIAGLYFPVELLPGWLRWMSEVQPMTPAVELLRSSLVGQSLSDPVWLHLTKLAVFAAVAFPLSLIGLRAALRRSRRRGTILEY